ncbi:hypothetical protein [Granulicella mallensis]|uniref:hypothetical protein n=1 Tax=Granulicella mallensis TaxID=940614 RepID=UPI0005C786BA|nr:hypothetical protein [Granulicella mallensis]
MSVSGNGNFVGPAGSLDLVTNGRTGEVMDFFSPGYFAVAAVAGGLTGGYTFGNLGAGNSNLAGASAEYQGAEFLLVRLQRRAVDPQVRFLELVQLRAAM